MSKSVCMYRITFKRHLFDGDDSWTIDRIMVGYSDLYKMCDNVMAHYPEALNDGNYIKIEEVIF